MFRLNLEEEAGKRLSEKEFEAALQELRVDQLRERENTESREKQLRESRRRVLIEKAKERIRVEQESRRE